jgi:hypothetical protein
MSANRNLLDPVLTRLLGSVDEHTARAITGICDDALTAVLGLPLASAARADPALMTRIAPWVPDLARGLQFQDSGGAGDTSTTVLLTRLASPPLPGPRLRSFAGTVDLAVVLTLGRLTEQVLGAGAAARDPAANELEAPWLPALKLGYRVGLALELLRLADGGGSPGTPVPGDPPL